MTSPIPTEGGHTPGPWHVDPKAPEAFYQDVNVLRHSGLAVAVALHNGDIAPAEVEANARLIAAAPAMLEALKLAREICKDAEKDTYMDVPEEVLSQIDAALAQATGGEDA